MLCAAKAPNTPKALVVKASGSSQSATAKADSPAPTPKITQCVRMML